MIRKFNFYQEYGVEEYYIYNPDNGSLDGWLRVGDRLEEIPEMAGFVSPRIRLRFDPGEGPDNLRIYGPDGTRFLTFAEWVEKAKADHRLAEDANRRAEDAGRRAEDADRRAERFAAKLRELGVEPERD